MTVCYMSVCALHTCNAYGNQKRALETLGLELQVFVSWKLNLGSFARAASVLHCCEISPIPGVLTKQTILKLVSFLYSF